MTLQDRLRAAAQTFSEHPPTFGLFLEAADALDALRSDLADARLIAGRHSTEARAFITTGEERGCQPGTCLAEPRCRNRAEMRAAHGTPAEFAASIARAAPELLGSEAERAIVTYNAAWADANEPSAEVQRALNSELSAMGCNPASATQAEFKRALWSAFHQLLPGKLLHKHVWSESGDGCWDCLLSLGRLGVPVYRVPDLGTDVALTFPRELLEGLVLEVREVDGKLAGYLRLVRVEDLSTPIGAPSLAVAEQFDAEARAAAEEPGTLGDGQGVDLWPGSGLPPLMSATTIGALRRFAPEPEPFYEASCAACEGEQFEGAICNACGDHVELAANGDGTFWRVYHSPAQIEQAERFQGLDDSDRE